MKPDSWVAVGTLALAGFTAWLAVATRGSVRAARDEQSGAWRPVLLPDVRGRVASVPSQGQATLEVDVVNQGRGPAFNMDLRLRTSAGELAPLAREEASTRGIIAAGEPPFRATFVIPSGDERFGELVITYSDLSGRPLWTSVFLSWSGQLTRDITMTRYSLVALSPRTGFLKSRRLARVASYGRPGSEWLAFALTPVFAWPPETRDQMWMRRDKRRRARIDERARGPAGPRFRDL